jgi:hypothetical protein
MFELIKLTPAQYSPLHEQWTVTDKNRPELIVGAGRTKADAEQNARDRAAKQDRRP